MVGHDAENPAKADSDPSMDLSGDDSFTDVGPADSATCIAPPWYNCPHCRAVSTYCPQPDTSWRKGLRSESVQPKNRS